MRKPKLGYFGFITDPDSLRRRSSRRPLAEMQRRRIGPQGPVALEDDAVTCRIAPDALEERITLRPRPCLAAVRTKYISAADFLTALAANRDVPLKVAVSVNGEYNAVNVWVAERVTSHRYDMQAMYDTIASLSLFVTIRDTYSVCLCELAEW